MRVQQQWQARAVDGAKPEEWFAARVPGNVQSDYAQARRLLGVVPQELVFDPFFSVREALRIQSGYFGIRHNEAWIDELCIYLKGNYDALCGFFARELPQLPVTKLEGTYLVWLDIRQTGLSSEEITQRLLDEGRVMVNAGTMYGSCDGEGYIRVNIACPQQRMVEGLERILRVMKKKA